MKIILYQPQIPQNTGNIARTCAATNADLVLVRPLGFSLSNRHMKRAGLDYWNRLCVETVDDIGVYLNTENRPCCFFSSKASERYDAAAYSSDALLIFGSETAGLPPFLWERYPDRFYTIPMAQGQRCLNLASSVAIVLYEALRQTNFISLEHKENPTHTILH